MHGATLPRGACSARAAPAATSLRRGHGSDARRAQHRGRTPALLLLLGLPLMALCSMSGAAAAAAPRGFVLPLKHHSGPSPLVPSASHLLRHRRRLMLRSEGAAIDGSIHQGYFTVTVSIGVPPQSFDLIIDTGSTMTYVPCVNCAHCGAHSGRRYKPRDSFTAHNVSCSDPICTPPDTRCTAERCYYAMSYAESSSSEGFLVRDAFTLTASTDTDGPLEAVIGCVNYETGMIYNQAADGILGLGNAKRSMVNQLADSGQMARVFGLCYGFPFGGALLLGDAPLPPGVAPPIWTPMLPTARTFYTVDLLGVDIVKDEITLSPDQKATQVKEFEPIAMEADVFAQGYGTALDSGSTFTYFPTQAFVAVLAAIKLRMAEHGVNFVLQRSSGGDLDICWDLPTPPANPTAAWQAAGELFPSALRLRFAGGATLVLPPQRYLFAVSGGKRFCLGILDNGFEGTLIGGISMRDVLVVYDLERTRIGFTEAPCSEIEGGPSEGGHPLGILGANAAGGAEAKALEAQAAANPRDTPDAATAAAAAQAKGQEAELVAPIRPAEAVTPAIRPDTAGGTSAVRNETTPVAAGELAANASTEAAVAAATAAAANPAVVTPDPALVVDVVDEPPSPAPVPEPPSTPPTPEEAATAAELAGPGPNSTAGPAAAAAAMAGVAPMQPKTSSPVTPAAAAAPGALAAAPAGGGGGGKPSGPPSNVGAIVGGAVAGGAVVAAAFSGVLVWRARQSKAGVAFAPKSSSKKSSSGKRSKSKSLGSSTRRHASATLSDPPVGGSSGGADGIMDRELATVAVTGGEEADRGLLGASGGRQLPVSSAPVL